MNLPPDEQSATRSPLPLVEAARAAETHDDAVDPLTEGNLPAIQSVEVGRPAPDPAWNGWDVLRLTCLTLVALFVGIFAALLIARVGIYPHRSLAEIARIPLVVVAGQSLAYLLIFGYMYFLVTRERRRPDFLVAVHWNSPPRGVIAACLLGGVVLSVALQILAHFLPIPKELPIDSFFQTPAEAWALSILSVTLAPLMEELFFRGFLYPVLARSLGLPVAVFLTALGFAALHGMQLMFSWGPVLVIFLVGVVLTLVRAKTNSVASGVLIHMAYNGTITVAMFAATDGFRHLEKLNQ
ncbi:MAG TPA: type II CAAX endopeptidase family protein [Terriglobales bacterium]|nr:type II CAAX endopeptidase family protein [Terriglobales bacterium]